MAVSAYGADHISYYSGEESFHSEIWTYVKTTNHTTKRTLLLLNQSERLTTADFLY